jgi:hypothetical protein
LAKKTYRAEGTFAFPRPGPNKPPQVVVRGNLYELDLKDIPKNLKDQFTLVEVASEEPAPEPKKRTSRKPRSAAKPAAVEVTITPDEDE